MFKFISMKCESRFNKYLSSSIKYNIKYLSRQDAAPNMQILISN